MINIIPINNIWHPPPYDFKLPSQYHKASIPVECNHPEAPKTMASWARPYVHIDLLILLPSLATPIVFARPTDSSCGLYMRPFLPAFSLPCAFALFTFERSKVKLDGSILPSARAWRGSLWAIARAVLRRKGTLTSDMQCVDDMWHINTKKIESWWASTQVVGNGKWVGNTVPLKSVWTSPVTRTCSVRQISPSTTDIGCTKVLCSSWECS